jgi:4-amino-4-deoxychorismate lyase
MTAEPLFIETMRIEDGRIANQERHVDRMRRTIAEVYDTTAPELPELHIPDDSKKCRVVYGRKIESVEFSDYVPRCIRSLKLVEINGAIDYHLKYADRTALTALAAMKGDCDEVLMMRDGFITDTTFSNVVLTDGRRFVTPSTYLLSGTMRAALLDSGAISEAPITVADLERYTHIALINAMLPLHCAPLIPIDNVIR